MNKPGNLGQDNKVADAVGHSWVYRLLPQSIWPYAQLARWERPIGWWLLMWPGWWSIMLANIHHYSKMENSLAGSESVDFSQNIKNLFSIFSFEIVPILLLFMAGAFFMRGAGCTYNDLADQDIDDQVARTRSRPLPSRRVSRKQALGFLLLQLVFGLIILLQFNQPAFWTGVASLVTIGVYPFMKRITWWPQLFLGFAFSWGALLGWVVVERSLGAAPMLLYIGSIMWVIGYDTIYAHQDKEDDALVGVKSTARLFGSNTPRAILLLYVGALAFFSVATSNAIPPDQLSLTGILLPAYLGLVFGGMHMLWQLRNLDIDDGDQCLKLFQSNSHFGWILFTGFSLSFALSVWQ